MRTKIDQLSRRIKSHVLIVDPEDINRSLLKRYIIELGYEVSEARCSDTAFEKLGDSSHDLVILSSGMPEMDEAQLLRDMKGNEHYKSIPVVITCLENETDAVVSCLDHGAEDYLTLPVLNPSILKARIRSSLQKKLDSDIQRNLVNQMKDFSTNLECMVQKKETEIKKKETEICDAQKATIFAMAKLAEHRDPETGQHLERMAEYCYFIASKLAETDKYRDIISSEFIDNLHAAAPLHDIGKVGVPDSILNKPGKLTGEEFQIMKTHSSIGADTLKEVSLHYPDNIFVQLGIEVAGGHHERWDGSGYPLGLKGEDIPLSARILALGDVYDALTSERCYKKAFSHEKARDIIVEGCGSHFDPDIVDIFLNNEDHFKHIRQQLYSD